MNNYRWLNSMNKDEKASWLNKLAGHVCEICDENVEVCMHSTTPCKFKDKQAWKKWLDEEHKENVCI